MKRARGIVLGPVLGLVVACGGTAFTTGLGDGGGQEGDGGGGGGSTSGSSGTGSSSGSGGGSGSSSSSSSSGSGSGGSGGSGGSSGSGSSSGSSSGASGGSSSSGSASDAGSSSGPGAGPCPTATPTTDGGMCPRSGLECEYGLGDVQGCDTVATCESTGWQIQGPTLTDCGTHPASCPATYATVPTGTSCTPNGLVCNYLEGRCECASGGGVLRLVDGSIYSTWYCQDPGTTGCPQRRPPLGSACTTPNLECDYGSCYIEGGTSEECSGGVWVETFTPCPE